VLRVVPALCVSKMVLTASYIARRDAMLKELEGKFLVRRYKIIIIIIIIHYNP